MANANDPINTPMWDRSEAENIAHFQDTLAILRKIQRRAGVPITPRVTVTTTEEN